MLFSVLGECFQSGSLIGLEDTIMEILSDVVIKLHSSFDRSLKRIPSMKPFSYACL